MRTLLSSLLLNVAMGWFIVGILMSESAVVPDDQSSVPHRISLLGNSTDSYRVLESVPIAGFASVQDILDNIHSASSDQLKRWLVELANSTRDEEDVMSLIAAKLASQDPEGTFEFLKSKREFNSCLGIAMAEWARIDLHAAFEALIPIESGGPYTRDLLSLLDSNEYEKVYQMLLKQGIDRTEPYFFAEIFTPLAKDNPMTAMHRLLEFKRSTGYGEMEANQVMDAWYRQDPNGAFEWVLSLEHPGDREMTLSEFAKVAMREEGLAGVDRMWGLLNQDQRNRLTYSLPNLRGDFDEAMKWIDSNIESPIEHQKFLQSLIRDLTTSENPERLADILSHPEMNLTSDRVLTDRVREASINWARKDPEGLQRWMNTLEDSEIQKAAQEGLASVQWDEAINQLDQHGGDVPISGEVHSSALKRLMENAHETGGRAGLQTMIESLPNSWREEALKSYVSDFGEAAPEDTIEFLESQPKGEQRDQGLQITLNSLAERNPSGAAEWVSQLEEGNIKELAVWNLANNWVRSDPAATIEWLKSQPNSEHRDRAVQEIVSVAARYHPHEALALAQSLSDRTAADNLVMTTVNNLIRRDPEVAATHLDSLNLSPALATQLTQRLKEERALRESLENETPP